MAKKKPKGTGKKARPSFLGFKYFIYLLVPALFSIGLILAVFNSSANTLKISSADKNQAVIDQNLKLVISPTSTPKPTPQIPAVSGRQFKVPVLTYHYIGGNPNEEDKARDDLSVTPDKFDEQLGYLQSNGYTPITLDELHAALSGQSTLPNKPVVITFDDGYVDLFVNAFPILQKYNFKFTVFIPTGLMNQGFYLSWDQLSQMKESGLISIQSHGVNHVNFTNLTQDILMFELLESKKVLEEKFGSPVHFIAYPYGTSNSYIWDKVKGAGYLGAAGTWYSPIQSEGTIYDMPRIKISGHLDLSGFISKL